MKRYIDRVWLRGACIFSAMLLGASMGGLWPTASAADQPVDESSGQPADLIGPIEGTSPDVEAVAVVLTGKSVAHFRTGNYLFNQGSNALVPLTITKRLQSNPFTFSGQLLVTYTALCGVSAVGNKAVLDIDIELVRMGLKPVITILDPTKSNFRFCFSRSTDVPHESLVMHSITGIATAMPLADYYVQIRATVNGKTGDIGHLGYTTLVVRK